MSTLLLLLLAAAAANAQMPDCTKAENILKCPKEFTEGLLPRPWHEQGQAFIQAKKAIMDLIAQGKVAEEAEAITRGDIDKALNNPKYNEEEKIKEVLELKRALKQQIENKYRFYNQAIDLTLDTYHLRPVLKEAPNVYAGVGQIKAVDWLPRYSEKEVVGEDGFGRRRTDAEALARGAKFGLPPGQTMHDAGVTTSNDARIRIFIHSFDDPGHLAATLYHETVHWLDIAGRGWKLGPKESFLTEVNAFDHTATLGAVFELPPDKIAFYKKMSQDYAAKAAQISVTDTWGMVGAAHPNWLENPALGAVNDARPEPGDPGRPEPERLRADEDFRRALSEIRGISRESKELVIRRIEERKRREEEARRSEERVWDSAWRYMKTTAGLACSDPKALSGEIAADRVVGVGLPQVRIRIFQVLDGDSLNACQKSLIDSITNASGPVPASRLVAWAETYRREHPGFFQRILIGLGDFFDALGDFKSMPAGSGGGGGGSPEPREPREPRGGGSHGSPNGDGPAMGQLRGISGSGWR